MERSIQSNISPFESNRSRAAAIASCSFLRGEDGQVLRDVYPGRVQL
jgi:hypothetical protein